MKAFCGNHPRRLLAGLVSAVGIFASLPAGAAVFQGKVVTEARQTQGQVTTVEERPVRGAVLQVYGDAIPPPEPEEVVIEQVDKEFRPIVTVIGVNGTVRFPNRDTVKHHVYSVSRPKSFEIPLYDGQEADPVKFPEAGIVTLGCNIHDYMVAYVVVSETNLHATSDVDGGFTIDGLAPGDYEVHLWHPNLKGDTIVREFSVSDGDEVVDMSFDVEIRKVFRQKGDEPLFIY